MNRRGLNDREALILAGAVVTVVAGGIYTLVWLFRAVRLVVAQVFS